MKIISKFRYNLFPKIVGLVLLLVFKGQLIRASGDEEVIKNVDFELVNGTIVVNYDLLGKKGIEYYIEISVSNSKGHNYEVNKVSGDVNALVTPGTNKIIHWSINEDYPNFDDVIQINLTARLSLRPNLKKDLLVSTVLPGYTLYKKDKKRSYLLFGGLSYALIGGSIWYEFDSKRTYRHYENERDFNTRNNLYNQTIDKRRISNALLYSGLTIVLVNYGLVFNNYIKQKKDKTSNQLTLDIKPYHNFKSYLALNYSLKF